MSRIRNWLVGAPILFAACADPAMQEKLVDLEARLAQAETKITALESRGGPAAGPGAAAAGAATAEEETEAGEILRRANDQVTAMDYEGAKATLADLQARFPRTRSAMSSRRLSSELDVIGRDAGDLAIESWYVGNTSFADGKATLVVFWEVWCPHCKREVPALEATWSRYRGSGLNMVGLTRLTKTSTEEEVRAFIAENNVTYPIAKEDGSVAERFAVRGIPAAAVVKDGKIVWRGHPARITDQMYQAWLDLPASG